MHAECSEGSGEEVPVCCCETACPVFHVEVLRHSPIECSDALDEKPSHHDEARFADKIWMEPALQPPLEERKAVVEAGCEEILPCFFQCAVQGSRGHFFLALVLVFSRDTTDGRVIVEDAAHAFEIAEVPHVILEEELDVGGRL